MAGLALAAALVGCGGESDSGETAETGGTNASESTPTETPPSAEATPTPTPTRSATPTGPSPNTLEWLAASGLHPEGYPYEVPVSELPDQVRSWYEMSDYTEAVAVAEGVWAPIPPGATAYSAVVAGAFDGFCASKVQYETDYLQGIETAGTCW
jgi:hypothetical protein